MKTRNRLLWFFIYFRGPKAPSWQYSVYWVHLVWSLFLFLYLIHFWWWEFRLRQVALTFPVYFFIALYATLIYVLCTLLFPDEMSDYKGFREYFYSRKSWFFSLLALLFVADIGDTLVKGLAYFKAVGPLYYFSTISCMVLSLIAIKVDNPKFQAAFALFAVLCEITFIVTAQLTMCMRTAADVFYCLGTIALR